MPELTDSESNQQNQNIASNLQEEIDLEELAERIVRILVRELKIEDDRTGNN